MSLQQFFFSESASTVRLPIYEQERSITNYFYQTGLPALSEYTLSLWFFGSKQYEGRSGQYLFGIATSGLYKHFSKLFLSEICTLLWLFFSEIGLSFFSHWSLNSFYMLFLSNTITGETLQTGNEYFLEEPKEHNKNNNIVTSHKEKKKA